MQRHNCRCSSPVRIDDLRSRRVLNSAGRVVTEIEVRTDSGVVAAEASPVGTTTGRWDPQRLSPEGGYNRAHDLGTILRGHSVTDQAGIDGLLVASLGAGGRSTATDITTAVSLAVLRASALELGIPVWRRVAQLADTNASTPGVIVNVINGGRHANTSMTSATECMLILPSVEVRRDLVGALARMFERLGLTLSSRFGASSAHSGLEGGYTPNVEDVTTVLEILSRAAEEMGDAVEIGLDLAANGWRAADGRYLLDGGTPLDTPSLEVIYKQWRQKFPRLTYLEDPVADNDTAAWRSLSSGPLARFVVADDVLSTSSARLAFLQREKAMPGGAILKVDQAGTVTDLLRCKAELSEVRTIVSQRSQETDSSILAHLAVGCGADFMKAGAPARERIVKYNELARIVEGL